MSDFFNGVKQWEFDGDGRKFLLPVFYQDVTTLNAIFTASTPRVRDLLPHPDIRPIEMRPGRCLVAVTCFEYRRSDIDAYNEVSVAFLVMVGQRPIPGVTASLQTARRHFTSFVWQLPVTTEIARAGGVDLYGFPKFLADITFTRTAQNVRCDLSEDGEKILSFEGRVLPTSEGKVTRYVCYPVKDGILLVANVYQNPIEYAQTMRAGSVQLELGPSHAIAETMRTLELSKDPILYQYIPVNEAILFGARNLMDD